MCTTNDAFFGAGLGFDAENDTTTFATQSADFRHERLVLHTFKHEVDSADSTAKTSFGVVVSSRTWMRNIVYAHRGQASDGILGVTDGTYRLHFGGWSLVDFGTDTTRFNRRKYSMAFAPWMYVFVRTESEMAYKTMFETSKRFALRFFNIELDLKFGSLDCTACIANAFAAVWPGIHMLNCYPHFTRKSREKAPKLLQNKAFFETNVWPDIQ